MVIKATETEYRFSHKSSSDIHKSSAITILRFPPLPPPPLFWPPQLVLPPSRQSSHLAAQKTGARAAAALAAAQAAAVIATGVQAAGAEGAHALAADTRTNCLSSHSQGGCNQHKNFNFLDRTIRVKSLLTQIVANEFLRSWMEPVSHNCT
ncbi:hypothetical protein Q3G72_024937 [Acer saccharum]|nr:hypothetical protein Q3G72_024937 [Acer saccharum]